MHWIHPNPRKRFGLEIARFVVYLSIPVVAITVCSDPKNMNKLLRGFNFVEYPPEAKKLPSGKEIVKMVEEREAKRRDAHLAKTRARIDTYVAARKAMEAASEKNIAPVQASAVAGAVPATEASSAEEPPVEVGKGRGIMGWWRRRGGGSGGVDRAE